jgi:alpha-beta hydrolase superfamily lysophospholipase
VPILYLHGELDGCVLPEIAQTVQDFAVQRGEIFDTIFGRGAIVGVQIIPGGAHFLHQGPSAKIVAGKIVAWAQKHSLA